VNDLSRVNLNTIIKVLISIYIVFFLGYLKLLPINLTGTNAIRFSLVIVAIMLTIMLNNKKIKYEVSLAKRYIGVASVIVLIATIRTALIYGYSISEFFVCLTPYFYIFLAFPLIRIFCYDGTCRKYLKTVSGLVLLLLLIKLIVWFLYNYRGIQLFPNLLFEFDTWARNGTQRLNAGYLIGIVLVFCVMEGFVLRKNKFYQAMTVFIFLFLMIVTRFRFQIAVAIATILIMAFFRGRKISTKLFIRILIVISIALFLSSEFFADLIALSLEGGSLWSSTAMRLITIEHYWNLLTQGNTWLGLGLLIGENNTANKMLVDALNTYYLEDLGIIGGIFRFGIFSIVLYGYLFFLAIKTCIKAHKYEEYNDFIFLIGLSFYMIVSCIALNIFDNQRALDIPFYIAIISYINGCLDKKREMYYE